MDVRACVCVCRTSTRVTRRCETGPSLLPTAGLHYCYGFRSFLWTQHLRRSDQDQNRGGGRRRRKKELWGIKGWRTEREGDGNKEVIRRRRRWREIRWWESRRDEVRALEKKSDDLFAVKDCLALTVWFMFTIKNKLHLLNHSNVQLICTSLSHYNQSIQPFLHGLLSSPKYGQNKISF